MNITHKNTFLGAVLAVIIATSCCWLPAVLIGIGGASLAKAISSGINIISSIFFGMGFLLFAFAAYLYFKRIKAQSNAIILSSTITCPECGHKKEETMPTNACQFFYKCENCETVLKPLEGDCCVYCSYGTVACPPVQSNENCC